MEPSPVDHNFIKPLIILGIVAVCLVAFAFLLKKLKDRFIIFGELLGFLWANKLWWMIPLILILGVFAFFLFTATQAGLAPFVYTLF